MCNSEKTLARFRRWGQLLAVSAQGVELCAATVRATDALIEEFASQHDMSPEFWMAVGQLRGAAIDCGNPANVMATVKEVRPQLGEAGAYGIQKIDERLRDLYSAEERLRLAVAVLTAEKRAEAEAKTEEENQRQAARRAGRPLTSKGDQRRGRRPARRGQEADRRIAG